MSIKCVARVWDYSKQSGGALLLMLAIADYAGDDGTNAFPSMETLAQKTRLTERHVRRLICELEEAGELAVERRRGRGQTHIYTVLVKEEKPDMMSGKQPQEKPDIVSPLQSKNRTSARKNRTFVTEKPDMMSGDPSLTVIDPDDDRSGQEDSHRNSKGLDQDDLLPWQGKPPEVDLYEQRFGGIDQMSRQIVDEMMALPGSSLELVRTAFDRTQAMSEQKQARGQGRITSPAPYALKVLRGMIEEGQRDDERKAAINGGHRNGSKSRTDWSKVEGWTPLYAREWEPTPEQLAALPADAEIPF